MEGLCLERFPSMDGGAQPLKQSRLNRMEILQKFRASVNTKEVSGVRQIIRLIWFFVNAVVSLQILPAVTLPANKGADTVLPNDSLVMTLSWSMNGDSQISMLGGY
ncbi:hypothetical protein BOW53_15935 [Solemya pervernicosa gill symbiont]|uniref:Uncharacterized protein n=1 Tax=Solemya pervernicosa gill symbiont TaxID=642797 RepID=A0A1T2KZR2_9GAMM|nr:hypothetical protein BOW53_15935 [Solemya pervernicosa gill symbiont]